MVEWPGSTPADDVLAVARSTRDLTHQVLALRGYVRMIGAAKYRSPDAAVESFKTALNLASRPEEIKLILGALPDFACLEALALAESFLNTEGVREEALAAVEAIKKSLAIE